MTTHRSLNKLEFKAHMSIHNIKEVGEQETHESNGTRDRFGKNHLLSDENGVSRLPRRQAGIVRRKRNIGVTALAALLGPLVCGLSPAWADYPDETLLRKNTDVRIETDGLDANSWLNQKFNEPEEKFGLPVDQNTSLGFNEDGDPALATTF